MRRALLLLVVPALAAGCGGGERQDANEPDGTFKLEVTDASFPKRQHIAESVELRLQVRNADDKDVRDVAVTVETQPRGPNAAASFGQRSIGGNLADSTRPVWVLEEGPEGGDVANVNTWSAGPLRAGETRELVWKLVATEPGDYTLGYRVAPGLTGRAQAAPGKSSGTLPVRISDTPVDARVSANGELVREGAERPER